MFFCNIQALKSDCSRNNKLLWWATSHHTETYYIISPQTESTFKISLTQQKGGQVVIE